MSVYSDNSVNHRDSQLQVWSAWKIMKKSGWVHLIWNPGLVLTAGCRETPGRARTFISDQSKEVSQDRERRRKLHRCIQTAIDSARRDWSSARRDWRLFFQTFQPSFVISWPISTNEPSLESLKSQQSYGAIFIPVSPRERKIAPFLRRVLTLSAQFPRIRTCSGQINLYRGEIAVNLCSVGYPIERSKYRANL